MLRIKLQKPAEVVLRLIFFPEALGVKEGQGGGVIG